MSGTAGSPGRISTRRRVEGLIVGILTCFALAYFIWSVASLTHSEFSGCWLSCGGDPDPAWGVFWAAVLAALLGTPIALVLRFYRVRSRIIWAAAALVVVALVVAWVLFSLDPDNAEFFVSLGAGGVDSPLPMQAYR